jgi:hypothetical protein
LYRFLAIAVLLDVKDIPQVGPLQWGRISIVWPDLAGLRAKFEAKYGPQLWLADVSAWQDDEEAI